MIMLLAIPAQADRLEDMRAQYNQLLQQKRTIEEQLLRLEGAFAERQIAEAVVAEVLEEEVPEEEVSEVEEIEE
jgi:hypothetical protein